MKEKGSQSHKTWVVEVTETGAIKPVEELVKGELLKRFGGSLPEEPGTYQWRPLGRTYSADAEHGSWSPVYGWGEGVLSEQEMPELMALPLFGQER